MEQIYRQQLLNVVKDSIQSGLANNGPKEIDATEFDPILRERRATFVTLRLNGELRGCIGSLNAYQPLVEDLSDNAYSAAFKDPRFPPLSASELAKLEYHISILTEPASIDFTSEANLIEQLRPHKDGLVLSEGNNQGTFLPSVWEQLPDKISFLQHLKLKANLPADYWSDHIEVSRYEVESF